MKLLWLLVGIASAYFAYHIYTHTRIRQKDLESVMMQNLVVEKGLAVTRQNTKRQLNGVKDLVEKQGNHPKDIAILNKAKLIKNYADSNLVILDSLSFIAKNTKNDNKLGLKVQNIALLNEYHQKYPLFVARQDTCLTDLGEAIPSLWDNQKHCPAFITKNSLGLRSKLARIEAKSVDKLVSQIGWGGTCCFGCRIYGIASTKSQIVKLGEIYEAKMILIMNGTQIKPQMKISEGSVNVKGDVGYIEIKNVKAQNYDSEGKATKILTGKITIKKADGSDTTFTLSTNYTIKKLVN